tara:strand:+ start:1984 stop:2379 length:396 start_codon:yes stop_codon:yes gene_type:complete
MKSFKTFVKESNGSGGISSDIPADFHMLDQEDVKTRVNAWLEGCSNQEFMSVEAALTQLAGKVQQLGLTFDTKLETSGESGSLSLPVSQFGEKLDPAETHVLVPTIPEDLSMNIEYMTSGQGSFRIKAKLN